MTDRVAGLIIAGAFVGLTFGLLVVPQALAILRDMR